jgi:hydrogenase expression/formation protein HypE
MIKQLHEDPLAANAAVIGEVVSSHPNKVTMKSRIGGTRVVNYLTGEQLPRIC